MKFPVVSGRNPAGGSSGANAPDERARKNAEIEKAGAAFSASKRIETEADAARRNVAFPLILSFFRKLKSGSPTFGGLLFAFRGRFFRLRRLSERKRRFLTVFPEKTRQKSSYHNRVRDAKQDKTRKIPGFVRKKSKISRKFFENAVCATLFIFSIYVF